MAMSGSGVSLKQHCLDHQVWQITADICQPWMDPYDNYFEYSTIHFDYLIIPADYLIIELNNANFYW